MNDNVYRCRRELHHRIGAGIQVNLWWSPTEGLTWIAVRDIRTQADALPVLAGQGACAVFDHP